MYRGNRPRQYLHCRKRDLDGVQVPNNAGPHTYNYRPNLLLKVIYFQSFTKAPTLEIFKYVRSKQPTWLNMSTIKVCSQENSLFEAIFREGFFFFFWILFITFSKKSIAVLITLHPHTSKILFKFLCKYIYA